MKQLLTGLCLLVFANAAGADWLLLPQQSSLVFASIKNGSVFESHTFGRYEGELDDAGSASLRIDLTSVDTAIEIRDQRMREKLFDTPRFATATYSATLPQFDPEQLSVGEQQTFEIAGALSLHGVEHPLPATLTVYRLGDRHLLVATAKPVVVDTATFGLQRGVEALREIAGLNAIAATVPVNFNLVFEKQ